MSQKFLSTVALTGITGGSVLKVNSSGEIVAAVAGTDYVSSATSSQWTTTGSNIYFTGGDVGIGTTNPATRLHVVSSNDHLQFYSGVATSYISLAVGRTANEGFYGVAGAANHFFSGSVAGDTILKANNNLILGHSSNAAIFISTGDKVGIKNLTPNEALDVTGTIRQSAVTSSMLKADANGNLVAATTGTDYYSTATEVLSAISGVDGSGSGLDADLLDGNHASAFASSATYQTFGTGSRGWLMPDYGGNTSNFLRMYYEDGSNALRLYSYHGATTGLANLELYDGSAYATITATKIGNWDTAYGWGDHDGLYSLTTHNHDSTYLKLSGGSISTSNTAIPLTIARTAATSNQVGVLFSAGAFEQVPTNRYFGMGTDGEPYWSSSSNLTTGNEIWHAGNDGASSGLDADLLDGNHASAFALATHNHDSDYVKLSGSTMTGALTFNGNANHIIVGHSSNNTGNIIFKQDGTTYHDIDFSAYFGMIGFYNVGNSTFRWRFGVSGGDADKLIHAGFGGTLIDANGDYNGTWQSYSPSSFAAASHSHSGADITSGTISTARLDTDVATTNTTQTIDGSKTFGGDKFLKTNKRVSGSQYYPLGHYTPGETVFEIDPTWTQNELRAFFNSNSVSWNADSTAPGGYCIYIDGAVNVGGAYTSGFPYIPVDTDDIFYMECWIKNEGTNQGHYMGSIDYNESFGAPSSGSGNPGSYGYWVMSGYTGANSWTKKSGYITGFSNTETGKFETGTKYWTPQALFNYSAGSGTRACRISGWKVIKVNHVGNRKFAGDVDVVGTISQNGVDLGSAAFSATSDFAAASHTHTAATTDAAGFMSSADKTKLNGIEASANNYSLPAGTSTTRGGFKIGYTASGKNYPVEVSSEQMYVTVPWTDTDTVYSLPLSSSTTRGGVKIGYTENGKNYPVELSSEQMYVNVPWTDTTYSTATGTTAGLVKIGYTENNKNYPVELNASDQMYVNVPWTDTTYNYADAETDGIISGSDWDKFYTAFSWGDHSGLYLPIGGGTITKTSTHVTQGSISASNAHIDLYNNWQSNTDQKGSIITFTDNYYDGSNYIKTTRAAIKGGTDTVGNTADGYLEFYVDSAGANSPDLAIRIDRNKNVTFNGGITGFTNSAGISGNNFNITGVNQLEINDPGEGIVFKGGTSGDITLAIVDDASDNILRLSGTNATMQIGTEYVATKNWVEAQGYITSETDSQTLSWSESEQKITISGGNNIVLSGYLTDSDISSYGFITSITTPVSGSWWNNGHPKVLTDGVMEIGKYVDWHYTSAATTDYDYRMYLSAATTMSFSGNATFNGGVTVGDSASDVFKSNGTTHLAALGNSVGVGTTSPNHKVDIYSNENVPLRIHRPSNASLDSAGAWGIGFSTRSDANNSTTDTRAGIFSYYNGNLFLAAANTSIVADPDAYARLTVLNNGYVGIGTMSPNESLHVVGDSVITGGLAVGEHTSINPDSFVIDAYRSSTATSGDSIGLHTLRYQWSGTNTGRVIGTYSAAQTSNTSTLTTAIGVYGTAKHQSSGTLTNAYSLYLDSPSGSPTNAFNIYAAGTADNYIGGNVGIGETSPLAKMEVAGSIKATNRNTQHTSEAGLTISYDTSNAIGLIETWTSKPLLTRTYNYQAFDISGTEQMRITSSGVGIGTTSPTEKLDVNGNVRVNGTLEATEKSFNIAHPTKEGKRLIYGVLEGPEHAVYVRGKASNGVIELPEEWTGLVHEDSLTVQLTPIGRSCAWVEEIKDNKVYYGIDHGHECFYFVQGTRKDVDFLKTERDA